MKTEPSAAGGIQVVEPGSADDPFTASPTQAPPAPVEPEATSEDEAATGEPEAGSQPDEVALTPEEEETLLAELKESGYVHEDEVQERIREAQSGWDKRNAALQKQLADLDAQNAQAMSALRSELREVKLAGMDEEEAKGLRDAWNSEDRQKELEKRIGAVDEYARTTHAYALSTRFGQYWDGQEEAERELQECKTLEDMDVLAAQKKAEYYERLASGEQGTKGKAGSPKKGPAGTRAKSDAGGSAPAAKPSEPSTEQTLDAMGSNIKGMFSKPGQFA